MATTLILYLIPPRGRLKIRLASDSVSRKGYLEIHGSALAVQFFYEYRREGKLIDVIGTPEGESASGFIFPVERTPTANTGFSWAPSSTEEALETFPILLTLLDQNGNPQGEPRTIPYEGHLARFFNKIFTEVGSNFVGSLSIESALPIFLTVLRLETTADGFQLTKVPTDPAPGTFQICIGF